MSECALLGALAILKRRLDLDWCKDIKGILKERELAWTGCFIAELQDLARENHRSLTGNNRYRDTVYDFVTFARNCLVHRDNIKQMAKRICGFCDPLDVVTQALQLSEDRQAVPIFHAVQVLKLATLTLEANLQPFC
jgi:hypothetical protein